MIIVYVVYVERTVKNKSFLFMKIETSVIWNNRSGENTSWFHPRCCRLEGGKLFMSLQSIGGGDFYGPVHESIFDGVKWSDPVEIPGLGWEKSVEDISEGVCDVVPYDHAPTGTVLAIGHNVYYRDGALFDSLGDWEERKGPVVCRFPVWSIRNREGKWIKSRKKLFVPGMEECSMYSCGSSQWFFRGEDEVYIPLTFGFWNRTDRMVCSAKFRYDGENLEFMEKGNTLELPVNRGLLEPSLLDCGNRVLLTIRAEDGCGYNAVSTDGLHWGGMTPWQFDTGEVLKMSTTQQHFLKCGGKIFLVYTRDTGDNSHVMRFRTPLFMAEITPELELVKESETVVFPMIDEGKHAPGMGNFQCYALSEKEAVITVGEERGYDRFRGNTLMARITF